MQLMAAGEAVVQFGATHPNRIPRCAGGLTATREREQKTERHLAISRRYAITNDDYGKGRTTAALDAGRRFTEAAGLRIVASAANIDTSLGAAPHVGPQGQRWFVASPSHHREESLSRSVHKYEPGEDQAEPETIDDRGTEAKAPMSPAAHGERPHGPADSTADRLGRNLPERLKQAHHRHHRDEAADAGCDPPYAVGNPEVAGTMVERLSVGINLNEVVQIVTICERTPSCQHRRGRSC